MTVKATSRVLILSHRAEVLVCLPPLLEELGYAPAELPLTPRPLPETVCDLGVDAVVMDVGEGKRPELEVVDEIQRRCPTPIVALTPSGGESVTHPGVGAWLTHPCAPEELERALATAQAGFPDFLSVRRLRGEVRLPGKGRVSAPTEASLTGSEWYELYIENAPHGVFVSDRSGHYLDVNPAAERITGYSREELLSMHILDLIPPEAHEQANQHFKLVVETGRASGEVPFVRKGGEWRWMTVDGVALGEDRFLGFVSDVTDWKRAEGARQEAERDMSLVLNAPYEVFVYYSAELEIEWVNQAAYDSRGAKGDALIGRHCYEVWHQRKSPCHRCPVLRARETGEPQEAEIRMPDGRWWSLRGYPIFGAGGKMEGLVEIGYEISERKWAEQLLQALNRAARAVESALTPREVFAAVAQVFTELDLACTILLLDERRQQLVTRHLSYPPNIRDQVQEMLDRDLVGHPAPVETVPSYALAVHRMESSFVGDPVAFMTQVLPDLDRVRAREVAERFGMPRFIVAPLIAQGESIGVLLVQSGTITAGDVPAITAFAHQLASAWHKAALYQQVQEERDRIEMLRELTLALTSTLEYPAVLSEILHQARRLVPYKAANVALLEEGVLRVVSWRGYDRHGGGRFVEGLTQPLTAFPLNRIPIETGRPLAIHDTQKEPRWVASPEVAWVGSHLSIPLLIHNRTVGLLRFDSDVPGDFDEADLEQLQPLAHAVAVALDNARLFRARQESESRLRTALEEKEVLLREIHHRVKNNLQIIAGLLELQYNATEDELVLDLLTESQARIQAIALIHEKLYQSDGLSRIDVAEYVRSLVGYLAHAYDVGTPNLNVQVRVDDVSLDLDTMVPCALIINELVANALQHAFPPDASPSQGERRVDVELRADDGAAHLCVADNGRGLPPHLDLESTPSLGLKLVRLLTLQLNGSLTVERHGGTAVHVNFALPKEKRA